MKVNSYSEILKQFIQCLKLSATIFIPSYNQDDTICTRFQSRSSGKAATYPELAH